MQTVCRADGFRLTQVCEDAGLWIGRRARMLICTPPCSSIFCRHAKRRHTPAELRIYGRRLTYVSFDVYGGKSMTFQLKIRLNITGVEDGWLVQC